jgi:hypothetical protein
MLFFIKNSFKHWHYNLIVVLVLVLSACEKTPPIPKTDLPSDTLATGVFIGSEGNYQWGNASLSFLDSKTGKVYEHIYATVNQKNLGDVLQSIYVHQDKVYLVVNNSGKIEIINRSTFAAMGSITGLKSPRYFLPISDSKAYVSDLYGQQIAIVDLNTNKVSGQIACSGWTEELLLHQSKVYVCNKYQAWVYVIDTQLNSITDSIAIGYGAISMVKDKNNYLWVLTTGNTQNGANIKPQLHKINPNDNKVIATYDMGSGELPIKLIINKAQDRLYWLNNHVWSMSIAETSIPTHAFVEKGSRNFYGIGIDTYHNRLMVSDAKDYVQKSEVLQFDSTGKLINSFKAGINTFFFINK